MTTPQQSQGAGQDAMARVLDYLDGLKDEAAVHIWPADLAKCATSECVVKVASVRMGSPDGNTLPLFSRAQVCEAIRHAQAASPQPKSTNLSQERAKARREGFLEALSQGTHHQMWALLQRAMGLIDAWQRKYGEHDPEWLPPAGQVELMEDYAAWNPDNVPPGANSPRRMDPGTGTWEEVADTNPTKCTWCRGIGMHGIPGVRCQWCDGTGKDRFAAVSPPSEPASAASPAVGAVVPDPIPMVLHCPKCGRQHIDAPELHHVDEALERNGLPGVPDASWTNPPHRSHLCHGCGHIWRPADVATVGVAALKTKGKDDHPIAAPAHPPAASPAPGRQPPEGYVLVPTKLPFEMRYAGYEALKERHQTGDWGECPGHGTDDVQAVFDAVLAAAPPLPESQPAPAEGEAK